MPIRHRRPHRMVSGAFWGVMVLADVAIFSFWAALGTLVFAVSAAGGYSLFRHRRMLRVGAVPVTAPSGAPIEITTEPIDTDPGPPTLGG
ncbi:hypothetical protein [Cryptosporangium phraense]|uniref:Uncharacterized protein n=1 Tax=Cryptosporangium phraense TaxID=2593070 RepID=A0A545AG92_9ACTN|nr:hypothetical protein [Cryptosporangium phraense]TQS39665.1 hypothetical protein FL583_38750 [Cryptosporangium phraense]